MRVSSFKISDSPGLSGKIFLITGGTGGIGAQSVVALANHPSPPSHIYFTGRSSARAQEVIAKCPSPENVSFIEADLASLASVKRGADAFLAKAARLDVLMLNAGILGVPSGHTTEGYEIQFGTNHVGHALLFRLLAPTLVGTPGARVIPLSSEGYQIASRSGIDLGKLREDVSGPLGTGWTNYARSKLANIVYGQEIARRYPELMVANIHPGVVSTDLVGRMSFLNKVFVYATTWWQMLSPEQGAFNQLWAATADAADLAPSGTYYVPVGQPTEVKHSAADPALGTALWEWTEKELAPFFA